MSAVPTPAPKLAPTPENIGNTLARNMFKARGNNFEIHLLEADLALLIKGGCEIALDGVGTGNVEALRKKCDELLALARQYASECGECNGTGELNGEVGFEEVCPECADIHAVIAKVQS